MCISVFLFGIIPSCGKKEKPTAPTPASSVAARTSLSRERLLADADVQKAVASQSQIATDETLERLAHRGWKRLTDDQLFQRVTIRRKLLSSTDITTCAAVVRDKATEAQTLAVLAKLDPTEVETFFSLKEIAALAEVKNQQPPKMILQEQFPSAFDALLGILPPDQAEHLGTLLTGDPARASDEDICWAEKTFLDALLSVHEPYRSTLARAVVQ